MRNINPLIDFLVHPECLKLFSLDDFDIFIQQSYATGLVARVFHILSTKNLFPDVPQNLQWHFNSAHKVFLAHKFDIENEVKRIVQALKPANIEPVFLKGAAYIIASDSCHEGRLFADVDIFVDKSDINATEEMLRWNGWIAEKLDEHDEKYYRNWMHEIPPMVNSKTNMTIDVHHNLIPLVSRIKLDSTKLKDRIVSNQDGIKSLAPEDKVLHSAAHLLLDGEFDNGFRDIHDLYLLITEGVSINADFLDLLQKRAEQLGFELVLYYCLRLQQRIFALTIADKYIVALEAKISSPIIAKLVLEMLFTVIHQSTTSSDSRKQRTYALMLFIRSHWLKMPMHILVPHLFHKAFITPYIEWKKNKELLEESRKN
jgi:hypothetical protein